MSRSASLTLHLSVVLIALAVATAAFARDRWIIVQSTTSTQNSGLYEHLLPKIEKDTGVVARVVAVGTGQAVKNARNCDGDVLLVHDKASEEKFVASGYGVARHDLMYNDFVIIGPPSDPAGVAGGAQRRRGARENRRDQVPVRVAGRQLRNPQEGNRALASGRG